MRLAVLAIFISTLWPASALGGDWSFGAYLDAAYLHSDNQPANRTWRSKSTSFRLDRLEANMLNAYARKEATAESRWGLEFGLRAGTDVDGLVPSAPPPANEPWPNAETWKHLSATTASYLFPLGRGLGVTAGLMGSDIGIESFHAEGNPNYTRAYLTDNVPYFQIGVKASYPFSESVTGALIASTGYNYLADPNNAPSWNAQLTWKVIETVGLRQNLYYGPDQSNTAFEYWRFYTETMALWNPGRFLLAGMFNYGNERQSWLPDTPYYKWMAGAIWARMDVTGQWRVALRPEIYWDPDGNLTGARQTLRAITATVQFHTEVGDCNSMSARLEYRYDRSTGEEGGFYAGANNHLVPDQNLLILGLLWSFEWPRSNP